MLRVVLRSGAEPLYLFEKCLKNGIFTVSSNVHVGLYGVLGQLALSGRTEPLRALTEGGSQSQGCSGCPRSSAVRAGSKQNNAGTCGGLLLQALASH